MTDKPKMDAATAEALEKSIAHWKENADAKALAMASIDSDDCALCSAFTNDSCSSCPVRNRTYQPGCQGSPYIDAHISYRGWEKDPDSDEARAAFRTAALAEVAFLEGLRDTP